MKRAPIIPWIAIGFLLFLLTLFLLLHREGETGGPAQASTVPILEVPTQMAVPQKEKDTPSRAQVPADRPLKEVFLGSEEIRRISKEAGALFTKFRNGRLQSSEWDFKFLGESLEKAKDLPGFGGFTRGDFPEITTGPEALTLANALQFAWGSDGYIDLLADPKYYQIYEDLILKDSPSLIVNVNPLVHLFRLQGHRLAGSVPPGLVVSVKQLWRNAMVKQASLESELSTWRGAYRSATENAGFQYPPPGGEDVFPILASYRQQLKIDQEDYLQNLERLFRDNGLLNGS